MPESEAVTVPLMLLHATVWCAIEPSEIAPDVDVATSENDICLEEINQMSRHVATFA